MGDWSLVECPCCCAVIQYDDDEVDATCVECVECGEPIEIMDVTIFSPIGKEEGNG